MFENLTKVKIPSEFKLHCKFYGKTHFFLKVTKASTFYVTPYQSNFKLYFINLETNPVLKLYFCQRNKFRPEIKKESYSPPPIMSMLLYISPIYY